MTNEASSLNVRILKNGTILKIINEPVQFEPKWKNYQQTLRTVQKNVNNQLTALIEQKSSENDAIRMETDDVGDEEDESDTENTTCKRKLQDKRCNNKKTKF